MHIILFIIIQGGGSKLIQNYQDYKEALLFQFEKVELIKGWGAFQVTSLGVSHFPSLKSFQEHPNEVERKWLAQKKNNIMLYISGCFYLMLWWKAKTIPGSTTYPFEEERDHSKIPQVLLCKLAQLNINLENNMKGCTN